MKLGIALYHQAPAHVRRLASTQRMSSHILNQVDPRVTFAYHRDTDDPPWAVLTIILLIGGQGHDTLGALDVLGLEHVPYMGHGTVVAFPSLLWHRTYAPDMSAFLKLGQKKIAFFFGPP